MLLNSGVGKDSWESLGLQEIQSVHPKGNQSWVFTGKTDVEAETLMATSCKELTHLKRPWCWEILRARGEGDDRGWDGRMASLTRWTWVWVSSGSWWWTGRPGVLQFMGSQRIGHDWATELNWTELSTQMCSNAHHGHASPLPTQKSQVQMSCSQESFCLKLRRWWNWENCIQMTQNFFSL